MNRINYLIKESGEELSKNDKVAAAITLRSLLEETVSHICLSFPKNIDNLCDKINYLAEKKYIDEKTRDLFHAIRLNGNLAAHSKPGVCSVKELKNYRKKLSEYLENNPKNTDGTYTKTIKHKNTKLTPAIIAAVIVVAIVLLFVFVLSGNI